LPAESNRSNSPSIRRLPLLFTVIFVAMRLLRACVWMKGTLETKKNPVRLREPGTVVQVSVRPC
jgi:hypothetical protein